MLGSKRAIGGPGSSRLVAYAADLRGWGAECGGALVIAFWKGRGRFAGWSGGRRNPHGILGSISQLPVRKQPGARGCFASIHTYHKRYSFQWITKPFRSKLFLKFSGWRRLRNCLRLLY